MYGAFGNIRQYCHNENDYSHTADPVGKAAPKKCSVGKHLNIGYNRRAGGGKAADDFKKCVGIGGDGTGEHKRHGTDQGQHYPGKGYYYKAFLSINNMGFRL